MSLLSVCPYFLIFEHPKQMIKRDLVDRVEKRVYLNQKQAEAVVNILFQSIIDSLVGGDKLVVQGFGSFHVRKRNARNCHIPTTGERIAVPAKKVPFFKAGKELRKMVDGGSYNITSV